MQHVLFNLHFSAENCSIVVHVLDVQLPLANEETNYNPPPVSNPIPQQVSETQVVSWPFESDIIHFQPTVRKEETNQNEQAQRGTYRQLGK